MIKIEDLSFSYGNYEVLKGISFKMEEGKIYGLLGENGVGKTTLLTLIAGLKAAQTGSILVDGKKPYDRQPSFLENIFYLPDVVAPVRYKAIDFAKDRGKFWSKFSLDRFNQIMQLLENDPQRRMDKMSLGQLKKTYISFALACNCKWVRRKRYICVWRLLPILVFYLWTNLQMDLIFRLKHSSERH